MFGSNLSASFAILPGVFAGVALKSTLLLASAWILARALRNSSAALRHTVWTAAAAAVLALPLLSVGVPAIPVRGALLNNMGVVFQTTASDPAGRTVSETGHPREALRQAGSPSARPLVPWRSGWPFWLMLLWAAGAAVAFAQLLVAAAAVRRVRRAANPSPYRRLADRLARELGIERWVDVLETSEGAMPMTLGVVRPVVLVPRDAARWSDDRRRIVLLHELAHVRRGDTATHLIARLALILSWWNPLAWIAWREFLKERERATDDLVLHAGARASDYAGHLLDIARAMQPSPRIGWAAVAMARRSHLEGRLISILDTHVNRRMASRTTVLAAALLAVALVTPLAALRAQDDQPLAPKNGVFFRSQSVDVEATIRAAAAQKNHQMLESAASAFEAAREYDTARKLLDSALAIRAEASGQQSVDYGVGLIKLGSFEGRRNRRDEAAEFYTKALLVLGDREEAAPALTGLGVAAYAKKNYDQAADYLERGRRVNPAHTDTALMWMALVREAQKNPGEADILFQSALAANPESTTILHIYAGFLDRQDRESDARAMMARANDVSKATRPLPRPSTAGVFRVGAGVSAPQLVAKVEPEYTEEARAAKLQGTVVVSVEIGPDGIAHSPQIIRTLGLGLDENAITAINQWRFKPGMKDGAAVTVAATIEVNFRLM